MLEFKGGYAIARNKNVYFVFVDDHGNFLKNNKGDEVVGYAATNTFDLGYASYLNLACRTIYITRNGQEFPERDWRAIHELFSAVIGDKDRTFVNEQSAKAYKKELLEALQFECQHRAYKDHSVPLEDRGEYALLDVELKKYVKPVEEKENER